MTEQSSAGMFAPFNALKPLIIAKTGAAASNSSRSARSDPRRIGRFDSRETVSD